jgi:hypothetical protein
MGQYEFNFIIQALLSTHKMLTAVGSRSDARSTFALNGSISTEMLSSILFSPSSRLFNLLGY